MTTLKAFAVATSVVAVAAVPLYYADAAGRTERVAADLEKRTATVAWTWTDMTDHAVRLSLSRNGEDFPTAGWGGTLFIGDDALGCAVAGGADGYNEMFFDVGRENVPTNGRYAVQIIATNAAGRVEEWVRGTLTVRANPAADGMPTNWSAYADIAQKVAPFIDAQGILADPANADALWGAVSNRTDALIQAVSPTPDFTTGNDTLVATIEATAPAPDLTQYLRKGEAMPTTGGVFNVSTMHFNPRLSVGPWNDAIKPFDIQGGSGAAFAFGDNVHAKGANTMTLGVGALNTNAWSFLWNGDANRMYMPTVPKSSNPYSTRYNGGFHVNPSVRTGMVNPLQNFWIGDTNLNDWITTLAPAATWATLSGKPTNVSSFANDAGYLTDYDETDPTVPAWAKAAQKPTYTASDVGAYSASDGTTLANIVNAWEGYWGGTNVIFEVTNYYGNTSGEFPRLRIKELREGAWQTVWDEASKFDVCASQIVSVVAASNRALKAEVAEGFAPKAWGAYTDKGATNVVGNSVWMTSPETYFAGGTEYQRVAVGDGAVCVLTENGAAAYTAGEAGTFRFQDEGGTNFFGFAKSDSYTIGCRTDGITVDGTLVTLRYDVIMGGTDVPIVYWRLALDSGEWVQLNNADGTACAGSPYTVTWYTSGGSYYAAINCGSNASGFFKAETSVAGDVVFETNMKARLGGGIECENTQTGVMGVIRPTYNGSTVNWTWSAR